MFRGTGLSHDVKCSHVVHMRESQGFIQSANNNLAPKSLQCLLHFQSHQNTWLKIIFRKLDLSDLLIRVNVTFLIINMSMRTFNSGTP